MTATVTTIETPGVVTGTSPLEHELIGVHPRLHLRGDWWAATRAKLAEPQWASLWARLKHVADQNVPQNAPAKYNSDRGLGSRLPILAMAYKLGGDPRHLETIRKQIAVQCPQPKWDTGLGGGHMLYGFAMVYDWLFDDLSAEERAAVRDALHRQGKAMYDSLNDPGAWKTTVYTCNHFPVMLAGLAAAGGALYGEVAGVAAWLRLSAEKARLATQALGPDGASQEGLGYGQYYLEFYLALLDMLRGMVGVDLFLDNEFLRNASRFHIYSTQPRDTWTEPAWLICLGDGVRYSWYGPDNMLRLLAAEYRDGAAQWFANETHNSGVTRDTATHQSLLWYDPTVPPIPPSALPTLHHFKDQDLVLGRSGWHGRENVYAFKCGPNAGHHALRHYNHDIGGGHMHPDAGHLVIFAHGDVLLAEDGYSFKTTAFHNTVLVNGIGQTGEGHAWFEDTELRRQKRGPRIISVEHTPAMDDILADVGPAYELSAGLTRFTRRVRFLKPSTWIVVDELETREPATFEVYWHSDFPFTSDGDGSFTVRGTRGAMRVTTLSPAGVKTRTFQQAVNHPDGPLTAMKEVLTFSNAQPAKAVRFVTVLETRAASDAAGPAVRMSDAKTVRVNGVDVAV
ncbi:MAG: heparinase II/III family protein [Planctomycetes bacterium]|nr:heparinase II/III family protein [Planctomycetota bacterium]